MNLIIVAIGIVIVTFFVIKFLQKEDDPDKIADANVNATIEAKSFGNAHISVQKPGGFDQLHVKDLYYATIGANMNIPSFKDEKFILSKEPTIDELNQLKLDDTTDLVLIEIHCIGINYADCCIRWGLYDSAKEYVGYPITPGFEFSGKVLNVLKSSKNKNFENSESSDNSTNYENFRPGDFVFGLSLFGAYSTHILVPSYQLFHKPKTISMIDAGGFLCTIITAYYALFELAAPKLLPHVKKSINLNTKKYWNEIEKIRFDDTDSESENELEIEKDETIKDNNTKNKMNVTLNGFEDNNDFKGPKMSVLIHSASGGVGSMLVQLCKKIANIDIVVGIVGGKHKIDSAKNNGCDYVINRKSEYLKNGNIWDQIYYKIPAIKKDNGFDIIFDANGISTLKKSYQYLKPTGKVIVYGFHTMLPHSGKISPLQWVKLGYNALMTPSFNPMKLTTENKSILGFNLSFLFSRVDFLQEAAANLMPWIEKGYIKVSKVTKYEFEDVAQAHRDIQSGKTVGKLVLVTQNAKLV